MFPAVVASVDRDGAWAGFPFLRFTVRFEEDGDEVTTVVVGGHPAERLAPGDAVSAWTDEEGLLAGVIHPGWPSTPADAFATLAARIGAEAPHLHDDEPVELVGELHGHDVIAVLDDHGMLHLGVEAPFDDVDAPFELDLRHLFAPEDRLPSEVDVRGALVADLEHADRMAWLPGALPDAVLAQVDALVRHLDGPLMIDAEGVSVSFTPVLFDGELWAAILEELVALWAQVDEATRNPPTA